MPSRDVEINLIGNDRTGAATRSAGNNLDQLARKIDKFNAKTIGNKNATVKTRVDNSGATRAAAKLKTTFAKAGDDAGRSFTSRFQRAFARIRTGSITTRIRQVFKVDRDARRAGITGGSVFFRAFINTVTLGMAGGQLSAGMIKAAPKMAAVGTALGAVMVAALIAEATTAISALSTLLVGGGLLAGPIAFLLTQQKKASDETKKQETAVAALRKRLNNAATKDTRERLQKQLASEQRVLDQMRKESQQWDSIKAKAKAFMEFISAPLKVPLQDSINAIFRGLDSLKGPIREIMASLGTALQPLTAGVMAGLLAFINALKPAIPAVVVGLQSWADVMPQIGTALGGLVAQLAGSPGFVLTFANSLTGLINALTTGIGWVQAFAAAYMNLNTLFAGARTGDIAGQWGRLTGVFRSVAVAIQQTVITVMTALDTVISGMADSVAGKAIPGFRAFADSLHAARLKAEADLGAMQQKWNETDATFKARQIKAKVTADIAGLKVKLAEAKAKLKDPSLSKTKKVKILANIADIKLKIATAKAQLASVSKKKTVAKLQAIKNDLEAKVKSARAALDTVKNKKTRAKIQADIQQALQRIAAIKAQIASVKGKTVSVHVNSVFTTTRTVKTNRLVRVKNVPPSAGSSWQGALSGGATSRTDPPSVNVAAPIVDTRVVIDGREIRAVARSTVVDENSRQAWRARVGRR